jgi:hypothetical protein
MTCCLMGPPVPAIAMMSPAAQRVDGAPFGVKNAPINSDGSTTLLSPGTTADDGFITPCGKTTPIHAAVPRDIIMPWVTTRNTFEQLAGSAASNDDEPPPEPVVAAPATNPLAFQLGGTSIAEFGSEDVEVSPSAAPSATTPMRPYWDAQRAAEESFDSIIEEICQSEVDHQCQLHQSFRMYTSNETKQHRDVETQQSSYLNSIDAKLRAVEQMLNRTVVSFATNFMTLDATLNKVEADTTRMSGLLEASRTQLHQLHDNEAARVTAMQEHCNCMDNMDAMLIRVTKSITKTMNLAQEMDSKILASHPTSKTDHQRPVDRPLAPGFVSPARPSANNMPRSYSVDSVPDHSFVPLGSPATNGLRPPL